MITTAEAPRNRNTIVVTTLVASILIHASLLIAAVLAGNRLGPIFIHVAPQAAPVPPPPDEIVTISRAVRVAPIPKLEHGSPSRGAVNQPGRLAFGGQVSPVSRKSNSSPFARVTRQQLAGIARAFARMAARQQGADDLRVTSDPAAAPKRYRLQLQGRLGHLHHGEGIYYPIRGWRCGDLDCYYVAYQYTHPDGTIESGDVPWPIHFPPNHDPFVSTDVAMLERTPLPSPPPGFVPPGDLGQALRYYFPSMQFEDAEN